MDPDMALANARHALVNGDLQSAYLHLMDVTNWVSMGGYVPDGYPEVLSMYNDMERNELTEA